MVIQAHVDDAALCCGGQLLRWTRDSWRVILLRATNDENASVGLSQEATIRANEEGFRAVRFTALSGSQASLLGQSEVQGDRP